MIDRAEVIGQKDELAVVHRAMGGVSCLRIERPFGMHADDECMITVSATQPHREMQHRFASAPTCSDRPPPGLPVNPNGCRSLEGQAQQSERQGTTPAIFLTLRHCGEGVVSGGSCRGAYQEVFSASGRCQSRRKATRSPKPSWRSDGAILPRNAAREYLGPSHHAPPRRTQFAFSPSFFMLSGSLLLTMSL